jgi:hypothetical protein
VLDLVQEPLPQVPAKVTSPRAQLQEAQQGSAELTGELESRHLREAALQQVRDRRLRLSAQYDRELMSSGPWPGRVKVGSCCASLLIGRRK